MSGFQCFKQLDSMDCGPTCLQMVAKHYGKTYFLQYLRSRSYISKSGVSMLGISDAAESIGFRTRGYRLTWEQLRDEAFCGGLRHTAKGKGQRAGSRGQEY